MRLPWQRLFERRTAPDALAGRPPTVGRSLRPEQVLRPVRPAFIWATLAGAFLLNLLPWGRAIWVPDFFALTLVFWNVHQPRKVGMAIAFVFGLLMDVHNGALFGEHALAYTLLSYGAITLHRRIQWFAIGSQCIYVFGLLLVAQLASAAVRLWVGGPSPGWWLGLLASALGAAVWPSLNAVLLAPQRRPAKRDDTRPL
jgi:rod shape-determining protein MreD